MNTVASPSRQRIKQPKITLRAAIGAALKQSSLPLVIIGCTLGVTAAYAQDARSAEEIQAEVARLKQELERAEQALAAKEGQSATPSATSSAADEAKSDDDGRLGVVTVRSRNRLEPLQEVPLAISVVTGSELERLQAVDISSITQRAANVSWNQGNQRTSSLSIRGVGKQGQTEAQDPSVGTIVDGVNYAYNALTSSFDFYDVDTVEVTRGPQGTLLGKNTSLGVVNITTRRPSFKPDAQFSLTFGEWDTILGRAAMGGPVIDDLLAWRGTVTVNKGEGDMVNSNNRDLTWQNKDRVYGRLQLLLTPTETLSIRLAVDKAPHAGETTNGRTVNTKRPDYYANGTPWTGLDNPARLNRRWFRQLGSYDVNAAYPNNSYFDLNGTVNYDTARALETGSNGATLDVNWNLGSFDLTSITAYKDYHFNATNDDGTPFDVYRNAGGFWNDYKQWTQELRLSSAVGDFVDYQTGIYLIKVHNTADYRREWGNDAGAWFATDAQYARLDVNGNGRYLMQNSLDQLYMSFNSPAGVQDINNKSAAVFGQANWHFTDDLTLTTGLRFTREDRRNEAYTGIKDNGFAPELNPSVVNGVSLGGFESFYNTSTTDTVWVRNNTVVTSTTPGAVAVAPGTAEVTTDTTSVGYGQALAQANVAASKYFGAASYAALTPAQRRQIVDALAIRRAAIGVVFNEREAEPFKETQTSFVISPSYKINDQVNTYFSWQYGEKAGISQFVNGISALTPGEETSSYEIGLKTVLFNKTLTFNTAVFLMDIKDYQQSVRIVDEYTTAANNNGEFAYTSATGNVPKVQVKGVEIDAVYAGVPNTVLRLAGSYNDARYKSFPFSAQPAENGFTGAPPYRDISGKTLPGAAKWAFNVGVDNRLPVFETLEIRSSANAAYSSPNNTDNSLSIYGEVPTRVIVDANVSIGPRNGRFDIGVLVKNALDSETKITSSSTGYTPAVPRWFGVSVNGKL